MQNKHPFHLVNPSPWPLLISCSLLGLTIGAVSFFNFFSFSLLLPLSAFDSTFLLEYNNILFFLLFSLILSCLLLLVNYIISYRTKIEISKSSAYECGFSPFSETSYPFEVQFAIIAIMFLLFDIEILYLFPAVTSFLEFNYQELLYVILFFIILIIGIIYEITRDIVVFFKKSPNLKINPLEFILLLLIIIPDIATVPIDSLDINFIFFTLCSKPFSFLTKIFSGFLTIICIFILSIRFFFMRLPTEKFISRVLPIISSIILCLTHIYPQYFSLFTLFYVHTYIGIQLEMYDNLGSRISYHVLNNPNPLFTANFLLLKSNNSKNQIIRSITFSAWSGLLVGKTQMTATGRATLLIGIGSGLGWAYQNHLDRQATDRRANNDREAANRRANDDREATNRRANDDRSFAAFKMSYEEWAKRHAEWRQRWFNCPEPQEPKYEDFKGKY